MLPWSTTDRKVAMVPKAYLPNFEVGVKRKRPPKQNWAFGPKTHRISSDEDGLERQSFTDFFDQFVEFRTAHTRHPKVLKNTVSIHVSQFPPSLMAVFG